eukprot:15337966-Ditylum_brightwellii.AAC.2
MSGMCSTIATIATHCQPGPSNKPHMIEAKCTLIQAIQHSLCEEESWEGITPSQLVHYEGDIHLVWKNRYNGLPNVLHGISHNNKDAHPYQKGYDCCSKGRPNIYSAFQHHPYLLCNYKVKFDVWKLDLAAKKDATNAHFQWSQNNTPYMLTNTKPSATVGERGIQGQGNQNEKQMNRLFPLSLQKSSSKSSLEYIGICKDQKMTVEDLIDKHKDMELYILAM